VQTKEEGLKKCLADFRAENPGSWVIGLLSSAGVQEDEALIRTVNDGALDVSFVVGGHDHEPFFPNKESSCMQPGPPGPGGAFACECASSTA
jgi:hypothetical protein